ncbi:MULTISPECIES: pyridoxamine 5'-phosphate oxidase family protein [Aerococcus]|uniref:Pyridoxamine 5'-phosphate oxidase family protein n=1 Tax=Aerococcus sanguinicola TaxID=119206 RepID=A0A5N1GIT6_9LACT|nr:MULTISPECIES: pyridoxamine 5'-phosphate oxidase family protein [Aerococcus]KAA9300314.1 pyridoxamine 5'-phosphate oxidase family protein [Aerococcus sanguinicola]MDK6369883.1 pyridoxamine 5'-phosphate oxidase family protein [Aerococcus sp. UMB9870]MDK6678841.1 pyridoxamine 5'-phosphate oxidase family protein [Aerococcus sp. UMB8608]MDK6686841.1 pyridoxamine 5'-phosphate oxidase family protein [Aerococcus sp. UMB8623]MDK6939499.1 pyridoxamine 5'-phosphate oxidase family protein [Aerococcus s
MDATEILRILEEDMGVGTFATVDEAGQPHARPIHIGLANDKGIFFMTSPKTKFYDQLVANPNLAIAAFQTDDYLVQSIRIEGKARKIGRDKLEEVLANNPFVDQVYPDKKERDDIQVFHLYEGQAFYHSLSQGHRYVFQIPGDGQARDL